MFPNELAIWGHRSGTGIDLRTDAVSGPFQLEIEGRWQDAAAAWSALGFPLEEARARANATDETSLREALATLDHLGARADAARLASRMRALGYRHIPRGPRPSTRAAHATLTTREIEVLARVASGETNGEIAARFYLSRRTIEHHVSSILGKLGASTREEAADKAREAGLVPG